MLEIFKAGTHRDSKGIELTFSDQDIAAIAAAYNPALHEAPIVVGHPRHDAPAYGWVQSLAASGSSLEAQPHQLDATFAELVETGRFKKISASFYLPDSPNNPKPGGYYLRHVGFLGAEPPAVKGLRAVEFSGNDADCITVEFSEDPAYLISRILRFMRRVRDWIIAKEGVESADKVIEGWDIDWLSEEAAKAQTATSAFSEAGVTPPEQPVTPAPEAAAGKEDMTMPNVPKEGAQAAPGAKPGGAPTGQNNQHNLSGLSREELESRLAALETRQAEFAEARRLDDAKAVIRQAVEVGRLTGAQAEGLAEFMAGLPKDGDADAVTLEFGEGEAAKKVTPFTFMKDFIARLPQQVNFSELSAGHDEPGDMGASDLANEAVAYQEEMRGKGVTISTSQAVAAVKAGKHTKPAK